LGSTAYVHAEDLLMARTKLDFPDAMSTLQLSIIGHQYKLTRVQRVDIGLKNMGYKTDKYRIVFFGKPDEIKEMVDKHPSMIAYLPMKIAIFAEGEDTLLIALNPVNYEKLTGASEYRYMFKRWENDLRSILNEVSAAE
jgi:uncharacterized protein (DUF302 family)